MSKNDWHPDDLTAPLELAGVVFERGEFHSGMGWYYWDSEYPDEGSCGAFDTKREAYDHARKAYADG